MKKYKLIKEYPGSPTLGTEIEYNTYNSSYKQTTTNGFTHIMRQLVENQPEYWELVVEKEYKILSFKCIHNLHKGQLVIIMKDNSYGWEGSEIKDGTSNLKEMLIAVSNNIHVIYSVKRLSDGEVFTVGDKYINQFNNLSVLKQFTPIGNTDIDVTSEFNTCGRFKDIKKKSKQKLFTTEDGVDIFEGDKYYFTDNEYSILECIAEEKTGTGYKSTGSFKDFSTKEAAEDYIVMNKPCLSYKEVEVLLLKSIPISGRLTSIKKLVKSRL